jgi:protein required for attachment to host cells
MNSSDPLEEVSDMVNEAVRLRVAETERDGIGPTSATKSIHNVGGPVPNKTYEPPQTPQEHETELFARSVAGFLLQAYREGKFQRLSLIASPQFLGVLRKLLDPAVQSAVDTEINKDYTHFGAPQLREQLEGNKTRG